MLFVNHHYAKAVELHAFLNERVRANNNVNGSRSQFGQHCTAFFARYATR